MSSVPPHIISTDRNPTNLGMIAVYKQNENFKLHFDQTQASYMEYMKKVQEENDLLYRRVLSGYMEPLAEDIMKLTQAVAGLVKANNTMIDVTRVFKKNIQQQSLEFQMISRLLKEEKLKTNHYEEIMAKVGERRTNYQETIPKAEATTDHTYDNYLVEWYKKKECAMREKEGEEKEKENSLMR